MAEMPNEAHQQAWENVRRVIEHHDSIINQRLTWYLVTNAFLFAACAAVIAQFEKAETPYKILIWLWLLVGTICSWLLSHIAFNLLRVPTHALYEVRKKWWEAYCERTQCRQEDFPPVSGWRTGYGELWFHSLVAIPRILKYAWVLSTAFLIAVGWWYGTTKLEVNTCAVIIIVVPSLLLLVGWCIWSEINERRKLGELKDD